MFIDPGISSSVLIHDPDLRIGSLPVRIEGMRKFRL